MLVVDTPFPPYKPIFIEPNVEPDIGDLLSATKVNSINHIALWFNEKGLIHRDGDLPAEVAPDGYCVYYKEGLKHRIHGWAVVREGRKQGVKGHYQLYGKPLNDSTFEKCNLLAIKYGLPLWVTLLGSRVDLDFEKDGLAELTAGLSESLNEMPLSWLLKTWGVRPDDLVFGSMENPSFKRQLDSMAAVIKYEKEFYLKSERQRTDDYC